MRLAKLTRGDQPINYSAVQKYIPPTLLVGIYMQAQVLCR